MLRNLLSTHDQLSNMNRDTPRVVIVGAGYVLAVMSKAIILI